LDFGKIFIDRWIAKRTFGHLSDQKSLLTAESQQNYLNTQYTQPCSAL